MLASQHWCSQAIEINLIGPDVAETITVRKPYALVGSDPSADVVIPPSENVARVSYYLHATDEGLFGVSLRAIRSSKRQNGHWIKPDQLVELGRYQLRARLSDQAIISPEVVPALDLETNDLGPNAMIQLSLRNEAVAKAILRRKLTIVGSTRPSTLRLKNGSISACHLSLYHDGIDLWAIDLLSHHGCQIGDGTIRSARVSGKTIRIHDVAIQIGDGPSVLDADSGGNANTSNDSSKSIPKPIALSFASHGDTREPITNTFPAENSRFGGRVRSDPSRAIQSIRESRLVYIDRHSVGARAIVACNGSGLFLPKSGSSHKSEDAFDSSSTADNSRDGRSRRELIIDDPIATVNGRCCEQSEEGRSQETQRAPTICVSTASQPRSGLADRITRYRLLLRELIQLIESVYKEKQLMESQPKTTDRDESQLRKEEFAQLLPYGEELVELLATDRESRQIRTKNRPRPSNGSTDSLHAEEDDSNNVRTIAENHAVRAELEKQRLQLEELSRLIDASHEIVEIEKENWEDEKRQLREQLEKERLELSRLRELFDSEQDNWKQAIASCRDAVSRVVEEMNSTKSHLIEQRTAMIDSSREGRVSYEEHKQMISGLQCVVEDLASAHQDLADHERQLESRVARLERPDAASCGNTHQLTSFDAEGTGETSQQSDPHGRASAGATSRQSERRNRVELDSIQAGETRQRAEEFSDEVCQRLVDHSRHSSHILQIWGLVALSCTAILIAAASVFVQFFR